MNIKFLVIVRGHNFQVPTIVSARNSSEAVSKADFDYRGLERIEVIELYPQQVEQFKNELREE